MREPFTSPSTSWSSILLASIPKLPLSLLFGSIVRLVFSIKIFSFDFIVKSLARSSVFEPIDPSLRYKELVENLG